jgi:hypothetical protein
VSGMTLGSIDIAHGHWTRVVAGVFPLYFFFLALTVESWSLVVGGTGG